MEIFVNIPKYLFLIIVSLVSINFMLVHWPASKPLGTLHTRKRIQLHVKMVVQSVANVNKKNISLDKRTL